ncbi:MAG: acyl-CoA dehydratase activase [Gemmatimonadales bacterium]
MPATEALAVAGIDVGTEYVKAIVLDGDGRIAGRAAVATRGYFEDRAWEALHSSLEDARMAEADLRALGATGFGSGRVAQATARFSEVACHATGAFHHLGHAMTLVVLGGHDPQVVSVGPDGSLRASRGARSCAMGLGSFLMYAARHLDVHPTRLEELAAAASTAAPVSSYCSVFGSTAILERLREGATREDVAMGSMWSVAERVVEIGGLEPPVVAAGGVAEFFPGVLRGLQALTHVEVRTAPEPMFTAAVGAALQARRS